MIELDVNGAVVPANLREAHPARDGHDLPALAVSLEASQRAKDFFGVGAVNADGFSAEITDLRCPFFSDVLVH
jgi:hypothetical protein